MDVEQGEAIALGHNIKIHFLHKSGRVTRVCVSAPAGVKILREPEQGKDCRNATQRPAQ